MASEIFCNYCGASNQPMEDFCDRCGAELRATPPQAAPKPCLTLLNQRYRILNRLGSGGFGTVYKVQDTQLNNRLLAAKKLDLDGIAPREHQDAINSFRREAMLLADLKHANLPRIYEHFMTNGDYFLIMDFIEGKTLYDYLRTSPIVPATEVIQIGIHLADVLDYLHNCSPKIIFRDLKPENIMLTPKKEIYLIDFGIARHFKPGQAGDTTRWGTREYAAPEQLAGRQTNEHSDIYSLGAVLHQLLSGDAPTYPPRFVPLKLTGGNAQTTLNQLITRMLERDPQKRPASAAEIRQKLQGILQELQQPGATSGAQASSAVSAASKASSTQQKKPGVVQRISPVQMPPAQPVAARSAQPKPQPPLTKAQGELLYTYSHASRAIHALAWSPDGMHLAAAGEEEAHVYVWQVWTGKTTQTYKNHTRAIHALAWSPDSQRIASVGNDRTVQVWQVSAGKQLGTYQQHTDWVHALAWSPDGSLLASGDVGGQIYLWDAQSFQRRLVYRDHSAPILSVAFSPNGALIASADERGSIHVWDVRHGSLRVTYTGHPMAASGLAWSPDNKQIVSSSWDNELHIWEADTGQQRIRYTQHQRMVKAVAWSHTNSLIASASKDKTVQIWNPQTGDTRYTYRGHTSSVNALVWSPDGPYLASIGDDAAIHVWRAL